MLLENPLVVFDMETNGLDIDTCECVEIACVALDPNKLTIIPGSEFESLARPIDLDTVDDTDKKREALSVSGITKEMLRNAPVRPAVIDGFLKHIKKITGRKKAIPCGFNISLFDLPLLNRFCREQKLADKAGNNPVFREGVIFDWKHDLFRWWFQDEKGPIPSFDGLRKFFGMSQEGAHRAYFDCLQEAWVTVKMLTLYQSLRPRVPFAGSAKNCGGVLLS
jgi:DNA polymerase III epsilon subunit-like protein